MSPKQGQGAKPQGKVQNQGREYLADGIITPSMLSSISKLDEKLLANGIHPDALSFMYYTSLPKGHPDHLNQSEAARQFFKVGQPGGVTQQTAKFRALNAFTKAWKLLLFGSKIEHFEEIWKNRHKKPESERKKRRIPIEEKAKKRTGMDLRKAFRAQEGLGDRGKMTDEVQEKCNRYVTQHYDAAYKKVLKDLQSEIQERAAELAGV